MELHCKWWHTTVMCGYHTTLLHSLFQRSYSEQLLFVVSLAGPQVLPGMGSARVSLHLTTRGREEQGHATIKTLPNSKSFNLHRVHSMLTGTVLKVHGDMFHHLPTLTTSVPPQTNCPMLMFWWYNLLYFYSWDFNFVDFMNETAFTNM